LYESGEVVYARMDDPGMGIPPDLLHRIWDPREQREGATSISLFEVRQIIEEHGGQVWGESEPGHGSTFYVVLPKALGSAL
jgi:signal transduction histidine kinase